MAQPARNERYDNLESLLVNEQDFRDDDEGVDERHIYHDEPKWVQNESNKLPKGPLGNVYPIPSKS